MMPKPCSTKLRFGMMCLILAGYANLTHAKEDKFNPGMAIPEFGKIAFVDSSMPIPKGMKFKVAFDMSKAAEAGKVNRQLDSLARFINMHVAAGVKESDIKLAMVLHGSAVADVANDAYYAKQNPNAQNGNKALINQLIAHGVKFYVCGQSAAYFDLPKDQLLPGVDMALSAMTAHAILAQQGYSQNPF
ncbi:DsrE family protein [Shewanella acanthi]|uniref:DsrE family protein n=1 Tax=Shewanella acanthi TaxID=2864212 RepID=UPI001C656C4D|nr:DsrE family protein [Shewanella acanthi]QYJ77952.1 DsrE family protein [Shewanella acanthi]